jgi:DNA-binding IclR family transcriptional regulator
VATNTAVAPKCDAAAHELQIPRSTAADAIRDLVRGGYLERAA